MERLLLTGSRCHSVYFYLWLKMYNLIALTRNGTRLVEYSDFSICMLCSIHHIHGSSLCVRLISRVSDKLSRDTTFRKKYWFSDRKGNEMLSAYSLVHTYLYRGLVRPKLLTSFNLSFSSFNKSISQVNTVVNYFHGWKYSTTVHQNEHSVKIKLKAIVHAYCRTSHEIHWWMAEATTCFIGVYKAFLQALW